MDGWMGSDFVQKSISVFQCVYLTYHSSDESQHPSHRGQASQFRACWTRHCYKEKLNGKAGNETLELCNVTRKAKPTRFNSISR